MTPLVVIQSIRTAFAGVPRPDFTLGDAAVADQWGDESVRFDERDQDWQDIPGEFISRSTAAFCFLPLRCWRYYIPAFMVWSVEHVRDFKTETPQHLVYTLTKREEIPAFRDSLTPKQREAVVAFLEFWRSEYSTDFEDDDFRFWITYVA